MTELQQRIMARIEREGPISFATYMQMALYEPGCGYYVSGAHKMGWEEKDYFTSTDLSSLFASCMGRQLQRMWVQLKQPRSFIVLEQGAGRGHLAQGVSAWAEKASPEFYAALDYRLYAASTTGLQTSAPVKMRALQRRTDLRRTATIKMTLCPR